MTDDLNAAIAILDAETETPVSAIRLLDYEIRSSWFMDTFAGWHTPKWFMTAASRYFAWKVRRKNQRYRNSYHWKAECRKFKEKAT